MKERGAMLKKIVCVFLFAFFFSASVFAYTVPKVGIGTDISAPDPITFMRNIIGQSRVFSQGTRIKGLMEVCFAPGENYPHEFRSKLYRNGKVWSEFEVSVNEKGEYMPVSDFTPEFPDLLPGDWTLILQMKFKNLSQIAKSDTMNFQIQRTDPDCVLKGIYFCTQILNNDGVRSPKDPGSIFLPTQNVQLLVLMEKVWANYKVNIVHSFNGIQDLTLESAMHDVDGNGGYWENAFYNFLNQDKRKGTHRFDVSITTVNGFELKGSGSYTVGDTTNVEASKPTKFSLYQNYPNPFNPTTAISFKVAEGVNDALLEIYNSVGQKVDTILAGTLSRGNYTIEWSPERLSAGTYICRFKAGEQVQTKKMTLSK